MSLKLGNTNIAGAQVYDATETVKGIVRLATSDEVTAGTNDSAAITPLKLKSKLDTKQDKSTAVNYNNISNCITYIPQDIKLELNNGTLTLKAGSKVYIANGNLSNIDVSSDITVTNQYSGQYMVIRTSDTALFCANIETCLSGLIANRPTSLSRSAGLYFATDENKIYLTGDSGANWYSGTTYTLPLCIITVSNGAISSIDQVFNGFGYIGSTVFALPGVKGLIPNGRNADGTLNSPEYTVASVITATYTSTENGVEIAVINDGSFTKGTFFKLGSDGYLYNNAGVKKSAFVFASCKLTSGVISNFAPKTPFHALDYNDKSTISGWSMPSSRYIDLTLGASGSRYTAPANGWFNVAKRSGGTNQYLSLVSGGLEVTVYYDSGMVARNFIPCKKGGTITVNYNMTGNTESFKFIYAEGEAYNPVSSSSESGGHESGGQPDWDD